MRRVATYSTVRLFRRTKRDIELLHGFILKVGSDFRNHALR